MKFAEFSAGQVIEAGPYEVSEEEIVRFATAYDPQWFHTDAQAAKGGRFEGLIASGWHTCGIAMRLVADAALAGSESWSKCAAPRARARWASCAGAGSSSMRRAPRCSTSRRPACSTSRVEAQRRTSGSG